MRKDTYDFVHSCHICQLRLPRNSTPPGLMNPVKVERIMQLIGLDIVGPFPKSKSGHVYIIVAVEYLSRFIIAAPLRSTSALEAAKFVINEIFLKFGLPEKLLTDNATTFTADFFQELIKFSGVCKIYSTPYHSTGNALVEKSIGIITNTLRAYCHDDPTNWTVALPSAVFSYNSSTSSTTNFTPYFLMFGRNPRHPAELPLPLPHMNLDVADYLLKLQHARRLALQNIEHRQAEKKKRFDRLHKDIRYDTGDLVLLSFPKTPEHGSTKLILNYMGPFVVTKQTSPTTYYVFPLHPLPRHNKQQHVHVSRMKRYVPRAKTEPLTLKPPQPESQIPIQEPTPAPTPEVQKPKSCLKKPPPRAQHSDTLDLSPDPPEPIVRRSTRIARPPIRYMTEAALAIALFFLPLVFCENVELKPNYSVTTGTTVTAVQRALVYTSSIPLMWTFYTNLEAPPHSNFTCGNFNFIQLKEAHQICQYAYAINNIQDAQRSKLHIMQAGMEIPEEPIERYKRFTNPLEIFGDIASLCCGYATKSMLLPIEKRQADIDDYFQSLNASIVDQHQDLLSIQNGLLNLSSWTSHKFQSLQRTTNLTWALDKEIVNLTHQLSQDTQQLAAILLSLQTLSSWSTELLHMEQVKTSCHNRRLPITLISPQELQEQLQSLTTRLQKHGYRLVVNSQDALELYRHPFTECTYSTDQILVKLSVPITRTQDDWKLYRLMTTPFRYHQQVCVIASTPTLIAATATRTVPIQGYQLDQCNMDSCYITEHQEDINLFGPCATAMFQGALPEKLEKICPLHCRDAPPEFYIISELSPNDFIITNPISSMMIKCKDGTSYPLPHTPVGALRISLPCNCSVYDGKILRIYPPVPCSTAAPLIPSVDVHIPAPWSNITTLITARPDQIDLTKFDDISSILNQDWVYDPPDVKLHRLREAHLRKQGPEQQYITHSSNFLQNLWMTCITAAVAILGIKQFYAPALAAFFPVARAVSIHECDSSMQMLTGIFTIINFIIVFTLLLGVAFLIYKLKTTNKNHRSLQQEHEELKNALIRALGPENNDNDDA